MGVGCEPDLPSGFVLTIGLPWMRRRLRAVTRAVLALVCLAWLQIAIVPCVMAHTDAPPKHMPAAVEHQHAGHGGHDHADGSGQDARVGSDHPCLYCPPHDGDGAGCGDAGDCSYPHEPQVDARAATMLASAMPVGYVAHVPQLAAKAGLRGPDTADAVPRVSLSVSYCRFIE